MGQAFGAVLPLAVAVAIFPVPIIAAVLLLASKRGRAKGLAFVLAWCAGLVSVGGLALLLAGEADASEAGGRATWVDVLLLGLGLVLLAAAVRQWRGRPGAGDEAPMPEWMRTMSDFTPARAGATGFALSALNPKNVLLTLGATAEIAGFALPAREQVAVLLGFVLVASAGVLTPLVLSLALGARSERPLSTLRAGLARHNAVIMTVLLLLIGAKLIGDAVSGFSG